MIKTKEIEIFIKDLKSVKEDCCSKCPLSVHDIYIKRRKYSILNNASGYCSYWFREISGINVIGKGCTKTLEEVIKYFTKILQKTVEYKNKI